MATHGDAADLMPDSTLILITTIVMIVTVVLAFIPLMPGPAMVWAVAIIFGALEGFERLTPLAAVTMTIVMIVASTSDLWLPLFGIKSGRASCLSTVGAFIGGVIGTFVIPIPILGTLIGMVIGALVVEFMRIGDMAQAWSAGREALTTYLKSYLIQLAAVFTIFVVYMWSLLATG
jgi:hypothetical protein